MSTEAPLITCLNPVFVFTDLKDSSVIAREMVYENFRATFLDRHYADARAAFAQHGGIEGGTPAGDSLMGIFENVRDAVRWAEAVERQITNLPTVEIEGKKFQIQVKIAIHKSRVEIEERPANDYLSHNEVNYTARLLSIALPAQILLSDQAYAELGDKSGYQHYPNRRIRNFEEKPHSVWERLYDGESKGEPGAQWIPDWFRENNQYIPRPALEKQILDLFNTRHLSDEPYRLVTLHGFGGFGKTRLGMRCAINAAAIFDGRILFARLDSLSITEATDEPTKVRFLAEQIARAVKIDPALFVITDDPITAATIPDSFEKRPALLLLDNYESVAGTLSADLLCALLEARPDLYILVTSRDLVGIDPMEKEVPVDVLTLEEARELLEARMHLKGAGIPPQTAENDAAIATICERTARIPLALELIIGHYDPMTLPELAESLAAAVLTDTTETAPGRRRVDPTPRHQSLQSCYDWSWELLDDRERHALCCLSLFADRTDARAIMGCFPVVRQSVLTRLYQFSLLTTSREGTRALYSMLPPTREYAGKRLLEADSDKAIRRQFVTHYRELAEANGGWEHLEDKAKRDVLENSWLNLAAACEAASMIPDADAIITIVDKIYLFGARFALNGVLIPLVEQQLSLREQKLGASHPDIAQSLDHLATLYKDMGRIGDALPLFERALAIRESALGENHPETASSLNGLAWLYQSMGRFADALPLAERALAIRESAQGESHGDTANSLNGVAWLYHYMGRVDDAIALFERALAIQESELGASHPDAAHSLNGLAVLYSEMGRFSDALPPYERALAIRESALGEAHPLTASSLNGLAGLYHSMGRYADALPLYERALAIRESVLGVDHPETAYSLHYMGLLYVQQEDWKTALPLMDRAVRIRTAALGEAHPDTQSSIESLRTIKEKLRTMPVE